MSSRILLGGVAVAVLLGVTAVPAGAACDTKAEQRLVRKALRRSISCASRRLRRAGEDCQAETPPACAAAHLTQILDLLGGLPTEPASGPDQQRCQKETYRAAKKFVIKRMSEREKGERRQKKSVKALRLKRCDVAIQGSGSGTFPRFGAECERLMSAPSGSLVNRDVGRCLRPEFEKVVSSLLGKEAVAPNVLLIVTDDQHPEGITYMPEVLSQVAEEGVRFNNGFTMTPVCAPSRAGILTGQNPKHSGVTANLLPDPQGGVTDGALSLDDTSTLANWFQAHGYRTAMHGKYLNGYRFISPAVPMGWDDWRVFHSDTNNFFDYDLNENGTLVFYGSGAEDYSTDVIAEHALRFIDESREGPFFLNFNPFAPHGPSTPAPRHLDLLVNNPPWRPPAWGAVDPGKPGWFRFFAKTPTELLAEDAGFNHQRETLLSVDEAVDAMLTRLEDLGLLDNTIVVFTSDHGLMWGEHGWTGKQVVYEESVRVPMAIRYPIALPAGTDVEELVLNIDIAPTLVGLSGIDAGAHSFDGRSLTDALDGAPDWRTDFLVEHFEGGFTIPPWKGVRNEHFMYVRHENSFEELYDLDIDPDELTNRASDPGYAATVAELSARMDEILAEP